MRIGVSTFGADGGQSGISRYLMRTLSEMASIQSDHEFELLGHEGEKDLFLPQARGWSWRGFDARHRNPLYNIAWHRCGLSRLSARRRWDVLFLPAANRRVAPAVCPTVGTVHDLSSLHVVRKYDALRTAYITRVLPIWWKKLSRIITVSRSTAVDLVRHAHVPKEKIEVIPLGAEVLTRLAPLTSEARSRVGQRYGAKDPYLLYVSRIEHPGKNHVRLIEAFDRSKERSGIPHRLILAGSDWAGAECVHKAARAARHADEICFTGFVPDHELVDLYTAADAFIFPSLYEGFGLPLLEAMSCHIPVACSNVSSIPEVAGDAGLLFDPNSIADISRAIEEVLTNPFVRRRLIANGRRRSTAFRWSTTARLTLRVLEQAASDG